MTLTQSCVSFFSRWFPEQTASFALKQMLTPPTFKFKERDLKTLESAKLIKINAGEHHVATWNWDQPENSKRVILVHGWAGASVQFRHFIEPLLAEGFNVTLLDLPAHGHSDGRQAHLPGSSRVVLEVLEHFTDTYAVMGHSFGAAAVSVALSWGAPASKVVLFAPMSDLHHSLGKIVRGTGADKNVFNILRAKAEELFNLSWEDLSPVSISHQLQTPALIIHDRNDSDIELEQSYRLQMMWPKSKLWVSEGLGHYRILKNKELIKKAIEFIKQDEETKTLRTQE